MIYIRLNEQNEGFFRRCFDRLKKLKIDKYNENDIITLCNIEKYSLAKLSKFFKINCTSIVCISEDLRNKECFTSFLNSINVRYFDGGWLYNHLITNIIEYIVINQEERLENQEISILTNDLNDKIADEIKEIAYKVKTLNIASNNKKMFSKIERDLFLEKGIVINVNNNYNKTLKKSNIIINYDFSESEINKYEILRNACIINLKDKVKIEKKSFVGINIDSYNINVPSKINIIGDFQNGFDKSILYESFIYKKTSAQNIKKEIRADRIAISSLVGRKGIIRKNEFSKKISI